MVIGPGDIHARIEMPLGVHAVHQARASQWRHEPSAGHAWGPIGAMKARPGNIRSPEFTIEHEGLMHGPRGAYGEGDDIRPDGMGALRRIDPGILDPLNR